MCLIQLLHLIIIHHGNVIDSAPSGPTFVVEDGD